MFYDDFLIEAKKQCVSLLIFKLLVLEYRAQKYLY